MPPFERARRLLARAIHDRVCPAACVEVGSSRGADWTEPFGTLTYAPDAPPVRIDTIFDLASLTKVIATTTLTLQLAAAHRRAIDAPVAEWIPEWDAADRAGTTVRDLLEHCSGLPAYAPFFERGLTPRAFRREVASSRFAYAPRTASVYSDLGFVVLGWILEAAGGASLDALWTSARSGSGLRVEDECGYRPPSDWRARVAPTRRDPWRNRLLIGEVDDNNAWALGGVAGHAGLFGTAGAVGRFARCWLGALGADKMNPLLATAPRAMVEAFLRPSHVSGSSRACGWDLMRPTSSCGSRMSSRAFGHTGFTGTSLWIDPERDCYVVLLTNRVHPAAGSSDGIQTLRRALHDALLGTG